MCALELSDDRRHAVERTREDCHRVCEHSRNIATRGRMTDLNAHVPTVGKSTNDAYVRPVWPRCQAAACEEGAVRTVVREASRQRVEHRDGAIGVREHIRDFEKRSPRSRLYVSRCRRL